MQATTQPKPHTLIVYSSPSSLEPLRLDREHRAIERVLAKHGLEESVIKRIHAATIRDVAEALKQKRYEVVYFSCHGSVDGICLERDDKHALITWPTLVQVLKDEVPDLCVL